MILIFSNPSDRSSVLIASWLKRLGASFLFLTEELIYKDSSLNFTTQVLTIGSREYSLLDFNSVWIRRPFSFHQTELYQKVENSIDLDIAILLREETASITKYIYRFLSENSSYFLANPNWIGTNKLTELKVAKEVGLKIPKTIITTRKSEALAFYNESKSLVSKSLYNSRVIHPQGEVYQMHTHQLLAEDLSELPNSFAPSLLQEVIQKQYDIRTFYLDGELYSMAIITSNEVQDIDYRKVSPQKMRLLPIKLDEQTSKAILSFMKHMNLKVGSLDLIKAKDGNVYFIEVNHEGQFNMIDEPCNYGIHRTIAQKLIKYDNIRG